MASAVSPTETQPSLDKKSTSRDTGKRADVSGPVSQVDLPEDTVVRSVGEWDVEPSQQELIALQKAGRRELDCFLTFHCTLFRSYFMF